MASSRSANTRPQPIAEQAALNQLRWLALAGILLVGGSMGRLTPALAGLSTLYGLWLVWQGLSARSSALHSWVGLAGAAADTVVAAGAVGLSGGLQSPLWWALLLPAAQAARLYGLWVGAAVSVAAWVLVFAVGLLQRDGLGVPGQTLALTGVGVLMGGLAVAWLSVHWPDSGRPTVKAPDPDESAPDHVGNVLQAASRLNESSSLNQLGLRIMDLVSAVLAEAGPKPVMRPGGLWMGTAADGEWELTIGFAPGPSRTDVDGASALDESLTTGQPQVVSVPEADAFIQLWPGLESAGAVAIVPLSIPGETSLGAVLMGMDWTGPPSQRLLDQLSAVGTNAALVWENANRYQSLLNEKEQLNELQEEARRRLARNLHDGPTQTIASIAMRANFARRQITRDPDVAEKEVAKVEEMARQTTREIRHMLFTLRPLILESQGLGPALYQLALKARDSHSEDIQLEIDPDTTSGMEPGVQGALFYIVEEAVTNAQKHAAAQHIWIRLKRDTRGLRLEVEDDGVGFNVGAVDAHYEQRGSLGMVNMRERAELAGGVLSVKSTEGEGTCISVSLPSTDADEQAE